MTNIKILDCTLRDGGYINNWDFGKEKIKKIVKLLNDSNLDYIEIGFLTNKTRNENQTLYNSFNEAEISLDDKTNSKNLFLMLTYGDYNIENIPNAQETKIKGIRLIFKKEDKDKALKDCKIIKEKGFKLFINPTFTDQYNNKEFVELIKEVNIINPYGFSIVDSMGVMKENNILDCYEIINKNLNKDISLCFHSHNNLQLSFSNAQCLMKICKERELIIDSTVFGMGRGAGNLCTELLTQYINDHYNGNYSIIPILKIIDEEINPIFAKTPWGYSVPYYLAATNHCHPNYAKYLVDKQTVPVEIINSLLKTIPKEKKSIYNQDLIKQIYLDNFSEIIDDSKIVESIKNKLKNKKILVLAPGKTLEKEQEKIKKFIEKENPYVISLNFTPKGFKENMAFVSNLKRFNSLDECKSELVVTSNIKNSKTKNILNYSSYINDSKIFDNVALMLLKLFIKIGINEVNFAGLDGFSLKTAENYAQDNLLNIRELKHLECTNKLLKENINHFRSNIKINFITKSILE